MSTKFFRVLSLFSMFTFLGGCETEEVVEPAQRSTNTYAVIVGMEKSKFAGECPGAAYDADRMYKFLGNYANEMVLLKDSNATKGNVINALKTAFSKAGDGLVIFFYSGHGGSEPFADTGIEETDGCDEFLCLWDTYLRDNDLWNVFQMSRGRIFMICDACHSQTMWRSAGFRMEVPLAFDHTVGGQYPFSLLCWSGCADNTYSYGASNGGQFTNAILRNFRCDKSYQQIWDLIKADKVLKTYEDPQSTIIGTGFEGVQVFR